MKSLLHLILILSLISLSALGYNLDSSRIKLAINCGSSQPSVGQDGIKYSADKGCSTGRTADYQLNRELASQTIRYTNDPIIYMTERHDEKNFVYQIPLTKSGPYVLILKFAEMHFRKPNKRQFNIKFGSFVVVKSLDIVKQAGAAITAYDEYIEFEYDDISRTLTFQNKPLSSAVDFSGNLHVTFEKIPKKDNPMVQGIVLFSGKLEDTDYSKLSHYKKEQDRKEKEEQNRLEQERQRKEEARFKKKERIKIRNDAFDDEDLDNLNDDDDDVFVQEKTFLDYFFSPIGLAALLILFFLIFLFRNSSSKKDQSQFIPSSILSNEKKIQKAKKKKN